MALRATAAVGLLAVVAVLSTAGCQPLGGACNAKTLQIAVQEAERTRGDTEEADRDGWPTGLQARTKLFEACPKLPKDIRRMVNFSVDTGDGQRTSASADGALKRVFNERVIKICADPSVFDEAPSVPPSQRGPVTMARCGLADEYEFGTPLGEAFLRLGFLAPVLRQYLIEQGIDSSLATQTVEMFGHPISPP